MKWLIVAGVASTCLGQNWTQADVEPGRRIYLSHCAECHGGAGEGGRGPRLNTGVFYSGSSDQALFENIQRGIPGTEMPGTYHEGKQIWQLVAFVRNLSKSTARASISGDAQRGQALYRNNGCGACHFVAGEGGRLGPDLTYIGSSRSLEHLKQSIVNPKAVVPSAWWPLELATKDGKSFSGYLLGEDSFHIRMIDQAENLRSFSRTDLARMDRSKGESRMPSYVGKLSESEMNDLLAYLDGLRRKVGER